MVKSNKGLKISCFNNIQITSQLIFCTRQVFEDADMFSSHTIKQELLEEVTHSLTTSATKYICFLCAMWGWKGSQNVATWMFVELSYFLITFDLRLLSFLQQLHTHTKIKFVKLYCYIHIHLKKFVLLVLDLSFFKTILYVKLLTSWWFGQTEHLAKVWCRVQMHH